MVHRGTEGRTGVRWRTLALVPVLLASLHSYGAAAWLNTTPLDVWASKYGSMQVRIDRAPADDGDLALCTSNWVRIENSGTLDRKVAAQRMLDMVRGARLFEKTISLYLEEPSTGTKCTVAAVQEWQ